MSKHCPNCRAEATLEDSNEEFKVYRCNNRKDCNLGTFTVYSGEKSISENPQKKSDLQLFCPYCGDPLVDLNENIESDLEDIDTEGNVLWFMLSEASCANTNCEVQFIVVELWYKGKEED